MCICLTVREKAELPTGPTCITRTDYLRYIESVTEKTIPREGLIHRGVSPVG